LIAKSHRVAREEELSVQREAETGAHKERQRDRRRREGVAVVLSGDKGDSQPISGK
jgi:hypothetical protein